MEKAGKVITGGSTSRGDFIIRYPAPGDASAMCGYINALSQEKTFILFQGEEISLAFEQSYLEGQLEKIANSTLVQLLATAGNEIIGVSEIGIKGRVESHVGDFGISVACDWRGLGVGSALLQAVLNEAQTHLPTLEIVTLTVFANNETAKRMYQRFGFQEFGRLPQGIVHHGQHVDHIYMYKVMR
jgi:RimJ/RimL family protein N-acetyltransferase